MAMEKQFVVREAHTRAITTIGYNGGRREILVGFEDGTMKIWESETGQLVSTVCEHMGWINYFLYWQEEKLLLSCGNDGIILSWFIGGTLYDKIEFLHPIYCASISTKRQQIALSLGCNIKVFKTDAAKSKGHILELPAVYSCSQHIDIVRNVTYNEMRLITAGYDRMMIIHDTSYRGKSIMEPVHVNPYAHESGITCLIVVKDMENTWIVTGSFDKHVKMWSSEGQLILQLEKFVSIITGICYVPKTKTLWIAGGTSSATLIDPLSGENVSDFISTFQELDDEISPLQLLFYAPELGQVIATNTRHHLCVYKYVPIACVTTLKSTEIICSLAYTKKQPILIFSGNTSGSICKWERMQSNYFMYSKENITQESSEGKGSEVGLKARKDSLPNKKKMTAALLLKDEPVSRYAFNKPIVPPIDNYNHPNKAILKMVYLEHSDNLVASSENGSIYIWGFDQEALAVLNGIRPPKVHDLVNKYNVLLDDLSRVLPSNDNDTEYGSMEYVMNRVAGFVCQHTLSEHTGSVTSFIVLTPDDGFSSTYLLSGGWDRRLCLWDLDKGILVDTYRSVASTPSLNISYPACDGAILDMAYNPTGNEFAYSSSDCMVYVRKFSLQGSEMVLLNTLQGHEEDITSILWHPLLHKWISGSDDGTIRIWTGNGMNECEMVLSANGSVSCLCLDQINGLVIAGVQKDVRVFDAENYTQVQVHSGHKDIIRDIIHIPERNQYISCSYDCTICVWNAVQLRRKPTRPEVVDRIPTDTLVSPSSAS